jgi:hypothetical protein
MVAEPPHTVIEMKMMNGAMFILILHWKMAFYQMQNPLLGGIYQNLIQLKIKQNNIKPYIKRKNIIDKTIHSPLIVDMVAIDNTELQLQIEKNDFDDFFFDLDVNQAIKLRNGLNEFIKNRK